MISKETLNIDWINQVSSDNRNADKILVEKVIRALLLLEGLSESGLEFIFKGGTAVMLLQGKPKRFSIDIDIIVPSIISFEPLFNKFLLDKYFSRVSLHERNTSLNIEKLHYKFFYKPIHQSNLEEDNILLDILVESVKYENLLPIEIDSPFVIQKSIPLKVYIPSIEDIFGDKLTAFAPNTTGIPYTKSTEIIKQLYDIGNLFEEVKELSIIKNTFKNFAYTEMKYRNLSKNIHSVLEDIIQTSLCLSTRGKSGLGDFEKLQKGISQLKAYIFSESYHIEKAIIHASRAAYIAKLIINDKTEIIHFKEPMQIKDWIIKNPKLTKLNKLKKSNPEAFFYWYQLNLLEVMK